MNLPLFLGQLGGAGLQAHRSDLRWLCPDGHSCRTGEVIASCRLALSTHGIAPSRPPLENDQREWKVFLATPCAGVLRQAPGLSRGGFFDLQSYSHVWRADTSIGELVTADDHPAAGLPVRLMLSTNHHWTGRSRVWWWNDGNERFGHVLFNGTCELAGTVRTNDFLEWFAQMPGPVNLSHIPDALTPAAAVLNGQFKRTAAERTALAADLTATFQARMAAACPSTAVADWEIFGKLLTSLLQCPFLEDVDVLTNQGVQAIGPPGAVVLSFASDWASRILRHRRLGYAISISPWRVEQGGPILRAWLQAEFEPVMLSLAALRHEYLELIDRIQAQTGAHILVLNIISNVPADQTFCYASFDRPLGSTLASIRAKELNGLLHELARERDISIIDVDALVAELGQKEHCLDAMHWDGVFQAAVRAQIMHILRERGVPGC